VRPEHQLYALKKISQDNVDANPIPEHSSEQWLIRESNPSPAWALLNGSWAMHLQLTLRFLQVSSRKRGAIGVESESEIDKE